MSKESKSSTLRDARQKRGWTQHDVAEQIGTTVNVVSRWELGTVTPSAYYCRKLCDLFGKSTQELGLLGKAPQRRLKKKLPEGVVHPEVYDPALPVPSQEIYHLVGRQRDLDCLIQELCSCHKSTIALTGLPGVGKTALVLALAQHPQVQQHFQEGILWVGLGQNPPQLETMNRWGELLGLSLSEAVSQTSLSGWTRRLHQRIGKRRMLLILDDAWKLADALVFQIGGEQCTHVLTTRFPALAAGFARDQVHYLEQLENEESITLLEHLAPSVKKFTSPTQLHELARVAGGLPLALVLIGSFLQIQVQSGQPRRIQRELSHLLQDVGARLSLAQPQVPWASTSSLPAGINLSLQATIQMSVQQLPAQAQAALLALSVFPPKPASFSEEAALAVCNVSEEVLDMLMDSGLLETHQPGRYHLHQTVVDYARSIQTDQEAENRLVQFVVEFVSTHQGDYALLEQEAQIVVAALDLAWSASQAGQQQMQIAFTQGMLTFMPFITARRLYTLADRLLPCMRQAAGILGDQEDVAWGWFHQGQMAELRSDISQAEDCYQQGLTIARKYHYPLLVGQLLVLLGGVICGGGNYEQAHSYTQEGLVVATELGDQSTCCLALKNLGEMAANRGAYQEAQTSYQQALEIARQRENWEMVSTLLQDLGALVSCWGDYEQAHAYYQEGLKYASQLKDIYRQSAILMNLGLLAFYRQCYSDAMTLSLDSLRLARMIDNEFRISSVLQNLGMMEGFFGHNAQAEIYLQESFCLAQKIGHRWLICETRGEWGVLYLRQQKWNAAGEIFEEMMTEAQEIGAQQLQASALFGLARVEDGREHHQEAQQYAAESLAYFQRLKDHQSGVVEQWLSEHVTRNYTPFENSVDAREEECT